MTTANKAAFTRKQRREAKLRSPIGYSVAKLMAKGTLTSESIAFILGLSDYQARGYMTRVTRGDFINCRF